MITNDLPESILKATDGVAMPLERVSVQGTLRDFAAEITVEQHYRNPRPTNIEAVYTFPLPVGAVLLDLELDIGDRKLVGQVIEKQAAQERYEDAVTDGDTAVMIEISGQGLYSLNFGNLMAGETAVIRYRYALLLAWQGDRMRLVLPTTLAPRYGDPTKAGLAAHQVPENSLLVEYPFDLRLSIEGLLAGGEISCPTHTIATTHDEKGIVVTLGASDNDATLDRDFVLLMRGAHESSACVFDNGGAEKVVLASLRIPPLPKREERPLRLKVVIDCSGSMAGMSIAQARKAALEILNQLRPGDYFNFTLFGSTVEHFWENMVPAEARYISTAWKQVESLDANLGGTETGTALSAVYAMDGQDNQGTSALTRLKTRLRREKPECRKDNEPTPQILLITDGQVWNHESIVREAVKSQHRIFTVGVGLSTVDELVGELAKQTGGACELVSPQEGMTERILVQFHRLRQPRVTLKGIKLGASVNWITPLEKAVFAGDTVHAYAGISGSVPETVTLDVVDADGHVIRAEARVEESGWVDLPRMAAAARIASSIVSDEDKLRLAIEHQLLTDRTNLLIVAERSDKTEALPELAKVAHMLPAGWGGVGQGHAIAASCMLSMGDLPAFLRKCSYGEMPESRSTTQLSTCTPNDSGCRDSTPHDFIANLCASLPNVQNLEGLPTTVEALEDYGLPTAIANALREISAEGWSERVIVAAFLMAMTSMKSLAAEFPREFSRLVLANWKRTDMSQILLDRIGALISGATSMDWRFVAS